MFGEDAIPRPSGAPRKSKSQRSSASSSATSGSSKNRLTEFFQEQIQLDREAKKESLDRELAARLAVVELQKRNEDLKILTFEHFKNNGKKKNRGMNTEDAARIEALKEKARATCVTPTPGRSYIGGQVSSVNVVDIDEFCLHDLKDMVVKLGYGVADLMYFHFLRPRLDLDYGMRPLNVDADVLEMTKYVKDYKIILVYVEHGSSNVDTSIFVITNKRVTIAVDNHLRNGHIEIDSSPDVNRNLTPMCHRNLTKEWEQSADDPFGDLDEILGDYANSGKQINRDDITGKHMVVHVDRRHDLSIGVVKVEEHDIDVIDYESFGSDLDDEIDSQRRIQHRELKRAKKQWFLSDHVIKTLATNLDIPVRAVQNQMQKQFDVGVSKIKAFRVKRIATYKMTTSTTVRIDVHQEPNPTSLTRTFRRVYVGLGALKQGFRACGREILGLDGCFMSVPWPGQILTAVGVDANNGIYPVAYC
ncbi:hypothetical protein Tco_1578693 [Tanacetum coccineum]